MQKLALPNQFNKNTLQLADCASIMGMAAVWMSLFKRLLYPVVYTYMRTGDDSVLSAHFAYAVVFIAAVLCLLVEEARIGKMMLTHRAAPVAIGLGGALGTAVIALPFAHSNEAAFIVGGALVALYVPTHCLYWALYMYSAESRQSGGISCASRNILLSFALFAATYLLLDALSLQSAYLSIACPAISTAMILVCPGKLPAPGNRNLKLERSTAANERRATSQLDFAPPQEEASHLEKAAREAPRANPPSDAAPDAGVAPLSNEEIPGPPILKNDTVSGPRVASFAHAYGLSQRETELASYAYRNYSAKRIAAELYIAESTVYTHLKRIYRKADVHSKQELIDLIDRFEESR